jgi:hypothetical protein
MTPDLRQRLASQMKNAKRQRRAVRAQIDVARDAFSPPALKGRAKAHVAARAHAADKVARDTINQYRIPLIAAAIGGLAIAFQEPIRRHGPTLIARLRALAHDLAAESDRSKIANDDLDEEGLQHGKTE